MNNNSRLIRILLTTTSIMLPASALAQESDLQRAQAEAATIRKMEVAQEVKRDVLRSLKDVAFAPSKERRIRETRGLPRPEPYTGIPKPEVIDTVRQISASAAVSGKTAGPLAPTAAIGNNFDGLGNGISGFTVTSAPPDTHGAVGSTQYVQIVNGSAFAVYNKATGALALGPTSTNSLWAGFGGKCQTANDGDPIINFDAAAQRWVITQFAVTPRAAPFLQCVAVSQTADATGGYFRYAFSYNDFPDYPKFAVHPDAYYFTFNVFNAALTAFVGGRACAYDRVRMLQGLSATQQCFTLASTGDASLLPSDPDGSSPVRAGSPNYLLSLRRGSSNSLSLYKFKANFANPALTTFTGPTLIPVAAYTQLCSANGTCVPQPLPGGILDGLGDRMMSRLSYRLYPDGHESLVANHSISTGLRWYEIRNPGAAAPVIFQQGTYAPSAETRWMGAMAQDKNGNFLVGYSASSSSIRPSLRVAARAPTDAAGTLGVENSIITGTGVQTGGLTRWGDYSSMTVDPVDNCTFWFTSEYLKSDGSFNWNTRIASVILAGCGSSAPPPPPPPPPPANSPPTTVADGLSVTRCAFGFINVTANDSDPEGNLPLVVLSAVSSKPRLGEALVVDASTVRYEANAEGTDVVTYTVRDSLGATSTGKLTVVIRRNTIDCAKPAPSPSASGGG